MKIPAGYGDLPDTKRNIGVLTHIKVFTYFCVSLLVLAACGPTGSSDGGQSGSDGELRVGLSVPNYGPYSPVYVAEEQGFYKDRGITVRIDAYESGAATQQALEAGDADIIHYFPPGIARGISQGIEQKIVAADQVRPNGWAMLVKEDSPIQALGDLDGKTVGITATGTTTDFYALWAANEGGVEMQRVPLGGSGIVPGLQAGNVEAAVVFPPLAYRAEVEKELGLRVLSDFGQEMPPNLPDVIAASQTAIDERPEETQAYLDALFEGVAYMKENEDYAVSFLAEFTGSSEEIAKLEYEDAILNLSDDGSFEREWLENSMDLAALGGIPDIPDTDELYTDQFFKD